jgi:hypothetical protein
VCPHVCCRPLPRAAGSPSCSRSRILAVPPVYGPQPDLLWPGGKAAQEASCCVRLPRVASHGHWLTAHKSRPHETECIISQFQVNGHQCGALTWSVLPALALGRHFARACCSTSYASPSQTDILSIVVVVRRPLWAGCLSTLMALNLSALWTLCSCRKAAYVHCSHGVVADSNLSPLR